MRIDFHRRMADPVFADERRVAQRMNATLARRAAGVAPRGPYRLANGDGWHDSPAPSGRYALLDATPLLIHVRAWLRQYSAEHRCDDRGIRGLARLSGVPDRRIRALVNGHAARLHVHTADRLAVAIGLPLSAIYTDR